MKLIPIILISFIFTGCVEQVEMNSSSSAIYKKDEVIPKVTILVADQETVTLKGRDLDTVTGVRFTGEKKSLVKDFKIITREFGKLVLESIDLTPIPVEIAMTMVLDNAWGQHKFPVLFSLQDNSVETRHIVDGNVTRLKLGKEEQDEPNDGDILKWDNSTGAFIFGPDETGEDGSGGTVTNIGLGNGIVGDGDAITTTGDIAVDIGITGHPSLTKIPFFNSKNQLVLDNKDSSSNPTRLLFSDGNNFSMFSDGSLVVNNENDGVTLLRIGAKGEVVIPGNLSVAGKRVCLQDGTDCPAPQTNPGGIENITVTHPILGGGTDPIVNISIDVGTGANQVVQLDENGALPAVDGSNLIGVVKGPPTSQFGSAAFFGGNQGESIQGTVYRIPKEDGDLGEVLMTDGTGNVTWQSVGGGTGDVVGPNSSTGGHIATYDGTTGKKIKDSGVKIKDLGDVKGPESSQGGHIATYNGTTGKLLKDSGTKIADLGDVKGSDTSVVGGIAIHSDTSGKVIKSTLYSIPETDGNLGQVLANNGNGKAVWATIPQGGDVVGPDNAVVTGVALFNGSSGKSIASTFYGFPVLDGLPGQVLTTNGKGKARWRFIQGGGGGDVTGPDGAVTGNLPAYNDTTGKVINDSGVAVQLVLDNQTNIISLQASNTDFNNRISTNETDITNLETEVANHRQVPQDDGLGPKVLISTGINTSKWIPDGNSGQVLTTDGVGNVSWQSSLASGDVTGPASSTEYNLAAFDGVTGKIIKDGGVNVNELLKSNVTSDATNKIAVYSDINGKNLVEGFSVPPTLGMDGQVLTSDGSGGSAWVFQGPYGDVEGPNSSGDSNIALFDGTNGKLIKDSGKNINDFGDVNGPASSILGNIASYNDVTGKVINDSGVAAQLILDNQINIGGIQATLTDYDVRISTNETNITNLTTEVASHLQVPDDAGNAGRILTSSGSNASTWLADGTSGQVLTTNGSGSVIWQSIPAGGDVTGPASSTADSIPLYDGTTGKIIKGSNLTYNGTTLTGAGKINAGVFRMLNGAYTVTLQADENLAVYYALTFPPVAPGVNQILESDAGGNLSWINTPLSSGGDVIGPATSTDFNIALFDGNTGKIIKDSGVNISELGDVIGPDSAVDNQVALYNGTTGKLIKKTEYTLPVADGNAGEVLTSDGNGNVTFKPAPGGGFGGSISICQIEMRIKKGTEISIETGKKDLRWDASGPFGSDCSWITYNASTPNGDYKSGSYFERFDLAAGNYMVDGWVAFSECGESWIGLANDTDGVEIAQGMSATSLVGEKSPTSYNLKNPFSLAAQKGLKVRFVNSETECHTTTGNNQGNNHELAGQLVLWKFN